MFSSFERRPEWWSRSHSAYGVFVTLLTAGWLVSTPGSAFAEGHATIVIGRSGQQMTIVWRDADNARFSVVGVHSNTYTLLRNGKIYIVANGRVLPGDMFSGVNSSHQHLLTRNRPASMPHLVGPKGTETVAGIAGHRYILHWAPGAHVASFMQDKPIVLTNDRRVRQLWQVCATYAKAMGDGLASMTPAFHAVSLLKHAFGNRGVLRMGQDFRVVKIDGQAPSASALSVPKHPS